MKLTKRHRKQLQRAKARLRYARGGLTLRALIRGHRRLASPATARLTAAKDDHADALAVLAELRAKALEIKDPGERAAALEKIKGDKPVHPTLVAIGCTVVAAVVTWPMLHGHHTLVVGTGLTVWLLASLIAGQAPAEEPGKTTAATPGGDQGEQAEQAPAPVAPVILPTPGDARYVLAQLGSDGGSVLLASLADRLAHLFPRWQRSTGATRTLLTEAGVRVRDGVRAGGKNGPGVHRGDMPPLPSPAGAPPGTPVVAVVGAGQSNNNNDNNTVAAPAGEGFVLAPDPANPARTIVIHKAA